jgi:hypothetical protein
MARAKLVWVKAKEDLIEKVAYYCQCFVVLKLLNSVVLHRLSISLQLSSLSPIVLHPCEFLTFQLFYQYQFSFNVSLDILELN